MVTVWVSGTRHLSEMALLVTKKREASWKVGKWDGVMNGIVVSAFCLPDEAERSRHVTMGRGKKKGVAKATERKRFSFELRPRLRRRDEPRVRWRRPAGVMRPLGVVFLK